ncbi:hypothetical protein Hanom_Chr09g00865021 [Helianthus anomalus]
MPIKLTANYDGGGLHVAPFGETESQTSKGATDHRRDSNSFHVSTGFVFHNLTL